jgi:hypothetical protein
VKKVGVIQFYFDDHEAHNQTADDVIRSFLKQIVYQMNNSDVPKRLGSMFDIQMEKGNSAEPTRDQFVSLLGECLDKFVVVYMCIDAFDECAEDERLKLLHGLQQLPSHKFRLFLTGRTYVLETPKMREDYETQIWLRDASFLEISATGSDIKTYLNEKLRTCANASHMEKTRPRIVDAISSQSNGQYILNHSKSLIRTNFYIGFYLRASNWIMCLVSSVNQRSFWRR